MTAFHRRKRKRKKRKGLEDAHGVKHKSREGMKAVLYDYFSTLFTSTRQEIRADHLQFIEKK